MSKIHKELTQLNINKTHNHILKNGQPEDMNRHFPKDLHMANRHIKDTQHHQSSEKHKSNPQYNYHVSLSRMAIITQKTNSVGKDVEQRELLCTVSAANIEHSMKIPQETQNRATT